MFAMICTPGKLIIKHHVTSAPLRIKKARVGIPVRIAIDTTKGSLHYRMYILPMTIAHAACYTPRWQLMHAIHQDGSSCMLYTRMVVHACYTPGWQLLHVIHQDGSSCMPYTKMAAHACYTPGWQFMHAIHQDGSSCMLYTKMAAHACYTPRWQLMHVIHQDGSSCMLYTMMAAHACLAYEIKMKTLFCNEQAKL